MDFADSFGRRGTPRRIYSDNGTNFVGANKELRGCLRSWNQAQIDEFLLQQQNRWTFNPPAASHISGAWERLIWSTRQILHALMKGPGRDGRSPEYTNDEG